MQLNIIAAVSLNGVIGNRTTNSLPWGMTKYPEDMAFFRKVTSGEKSVVIMGSSTMKSIGRKLPKRRNIVISRTADLYKQEETGIETYSTVEEALLQCREDETVWIIGGGVIYQQTIDLAHKLYITIIPEVIKSDDPTELVYFPFLNNFEYEITEEIPLAADKNLFCHFYERRVWLKEPVKAEEKQFIDNMSVLKPNHTFVPVKEF